MQSQVEALSITARREWPLRAEPGGSPEHLQVPISMVEKRGASSPGSLNASPPLCQLPGAPWHPAARPVPAVSSPRLASSPPLVALPCAELAAAMEPAWVFGAAPHSTPRGSQAPLGTLAAGTAPRK